jgi:hypothetical protein
MAGHGWILGNCRAEMAINLPATKAGFGYLQTKLNGSTILVTLLKAGNLNGAGFVYWR